MFRLASVDRILFFSVVALVFGGLLIFLSASLGLFATGGSTKFSDVAIGQIVLGLGGGFLAFIVGVSVSHKIWRRSAFFLFIATVLLTLSVFIPGFGLELNGAHRWIHIGSFTFQPAELLKVAYVLFLASWLSGVKRTVGNPLNGLVPFMAITGVVGIVLLAQPDTDTFVVIAMAGGAMFFSAGARARDIAAILLVAAIGFAVLVSMRPYLAERVTTFFNPSSDPRGSSYQIQQSLLAVGAGEVFGRGFGKSIQKFGKLPEPISDSIFSVFAEEFGFVGCTILIIGFLTFSLRGLWIAARSPDMFGGLVAIGIVTIIITQSFMNMAAMLGLIPLSGLPLVFVSHGGSALAVALGACGVLLSVSRGVRS